LQTGGRRNERFTLPNLQRPVSASVASAFSQPPVIETGLLNQGAIMINENLVEKDRQQSLHYVGFAEFGLRP